MKVQNDFTPLVYSYPAQTAEKFSVAETAGGKVMPTRAGSPPRICVGALGQRRSNARCIWHQ